MSDDEGPPPLEDMHDLIEMRKKNKPATAEQV
jgi:hypothetical protein